MNIDLAQVNYAVRASSITLSDQIYQIKGDIIGSLHSEAPRPPSDPQQLMLLVADQNKQTIQIFSELTIELSAANGFMADLPEQGENSMKLTKLSQKVTDCNKTFDDARKQVIGYANDSQLDPKLAKQEAMRLMRVTNPCRSVVIDLRGQSTELFVSIEQAATQLRKEMDEKSALAWWIAAILYTIGWSLTLLGRVYGVPIEAAQE